MSSNNQQQPPARKSRWGGAPSSSSSPPKASSTSSNTSSSQHQQRRGYDTGTTKKYNHEQDYNRHRSNSTSSNNMSSGRGRNYHDGNYGMGREGGYRVTPASGERCDDWKCMECGSYNDPRDDYCHRCHRNNDTYDNNYYRYNERRGRYGDDDWRCMECGVFNHPRDDQCHRCHHYSLEKNNDELSARPRKKKRREGNGDDYDDDDGMSRQQQQQQQHDKYKDLRDQFKQRQKREWPPSFDTEGASYIFDARSGMFYHPPSDCFYDPKTKLYYSNKKAQYFHFVGAEDANAIPFLPVQGGGGNGVGGGGGIVGTEGSNADALDKKATADPEQKPKIAISLKTKVSNYPPMKSLNEVAAIEKGKLNEQNKVARKDSSNLTTAESSIALKPQSHKKHEEDMEKWSGRVKELHNNEESGSDAAGAEKTDSSSLRNIKTTRSGQPICLICRRKFVSVEKLKQHEKLSALHKENLSKKAVLAEQKEKEALYRDRSKERRMMYGDDVASCHLHGPTSRAEAILAQADGSRVSASSAAKTAEVVRPEDTLGDTNVGNKLLQKLGWKGGDKLGRRQEENSAQSKGDNDAASSIKSDWERIESLAQGGKRR